MDIDTVFIGNKSQPALFRVPDRGSANPSPLGDRVSMIQNYPRLQGLRKRYWGQHLRARGYWVYSSGNVPDDVWKEYIKNQKPPDPDDDFQVV